MRILALVFLSVPFNQFPNIFVIFVIFAGGDKSKVNWTMRHTSLAKRNL